MKIKQLFQKWFPFLNEVVKHAKAVKPLFEKPVFLKHYNLTMFGNAGHNWDSMKKGCYEVKEFQKIKSILEDVSVLIDVGANNGLYTILAARMSKKVIAFEPMPINVKYLLKNIGFHRVESKVELYPVALSTENRITTIYGNYSWASLLSSQVDSSLIPVMRFDNLMLGRFAGKKILIKIDTEGCEKVVIEGMKAMLNNYPKPVWFVEITQNREAIFHLFKEYGYHVEWLDQSNYIFAD